MAENFFKVAMYDAKGVKNKVVQNFMLYYLVFYYFEIRTKSLKISAKNPIFRYKLTNGLERSILMMVLAF